MESKYLGEVVSWDGQSRHATIEDMDMIHPNIPSNQLMLHMQNSIAGKTDIWYFHLFLGCFPSNESDRYANE